MVKIDYNDIEVSTKTIIGISNVELEIEQIFNKIPITQYVVVQRRRGRKKKEADIDPNKDIPIGTAQPTVSETSSIKHHLIGVKPVTEIINAGSYAKLVIKCIEKIKSINKVPIICGGSGLYFRAISKGIFDSSRSELEVRGKLELEYENGGAAKMLKRTPACNL